MFLGRKYEEWKIQVEIQYKYAPKSSCLTFLITYIERLNKLVTKEKNKMYFFIVSFVSCSY